MARITVRVQPGASRDGLSIKGQTIAIRLAAPAIEGKANRRLIAFLAKRLGVRQADVTIVRGERSRAKVLEVAGIEADEIFARL